MLPTEIFARIILEMLEKGGAEMSEFFDRKEVLKKLILRLHKDPDSVERIKKDFGNLVRELTPLEIAQVEQELVREGLPSESIQLLCDVHLDIFKQAIIDDELEVEPWHPVYILMEEHRAMLNGAKELRDTLESLNAEGQQPTLDKVKKIMELTAFFGEAEKYFQREENSLFPYLERHGLIQPPAIMWKEHDDIRKLRKDFNQILSSDPTGSLKRLKELSIAMSETLSNHIYKEHKVLFPTALKLITEEEWKEIRHDFEEIGYFAYTPMPMEFQIEAVGEVQGRSVNLGSGLLTEEQLKLILNNLPIDITYVDANDTVKYFSETKDRIFVRTRGIIGRKVQNCHPEKSVHIVNSILEDFKSGKREQADFWLSVDDMFVYIKYVALRDASGEYIGALEITQDVAPLKKLEGEKRLYEHV